MVLQDLSKVRVANRKKRVLLQIESEEAEPQPAERDRQDHVHQGWQGTLRKFRPRHPEKIHKAHENQPQGDLREHSCTTFHILGKEQEKRNEEMKNQHEHGNDAPATVQPCAIETDFL